jgi:hypothetical protein
MSGTNPEEKVVTVRLQRTGLVEWFASFVGENQMERLKVSELRDEELINRLGFGIQVLSQKCIFEPLGKEGSGELQDVEIEFVRDPGSVETRPHCREVLFHFTYPVRAGLK